MADPQPIVHFSKWLIPSRRAASSDILILPSGVSQARHEWLTLQNQVWREEIGRRRDWTTPWYNREFLRGNLQQEIWFARHWRTSGDSETWGTIAMEWPPSESEASCVRWLAVGPAYRNRGVGTALLLHAESEAWRRGFSRIKAETLRSWTAAMRLYRGLGYVESTE